MSNAFFNTYRHLFEYEDVKQYEDDRGLTERMNEIEEKY